MGIGVASLRMDVFYASRSVKILTKTSQQPGAPHVLRGNVDCVYGTITSLHRHDPRQRGIQGETYDK